MPESASKLTLFLMRVRLGSETTPAVRPRKRRAHLGSVRVRVRVGGRGTG